MYSMVMETHYFNTFFRLEASCQLTFIIICQLITISCQTITSEVMIRKLGNPTSVNLLSRIVEEYGKEGELMVFVNDSVEGKSYNLINNLKEKSVIILNENSLPEDYHLVKTHIAIFVIFVTDSEHFKEILNNVSRLPFWKARAKYVIIYDKSYDDKHIGNIFKICLENKIVNVIVITFYGEVNYNISRNSNNISAQDNSTNFKIFDVYTFFPYSKRYCRNYVEPKLIDSWQSGKFLSNVNLFPNKVSNLHGCPIRVSTFYLPPHVILTETEPYVMDGIEGKTLYAAADKLNFSLSVNIPADKDLWGRLLDNGSYTGIMGDILYDRADIGCAGMSPEEERNIIMEVSNSIIRQELPFAVPEALRIPEWFSVVLPFNYVLWLVVILSLFSIGITFSGMKRFFMDRERSLFQTGGFPWLYTLAIIVSQSAESPNTAVFRLFYVLCLFTTFIICSAYTSGLVSFLTVPSYYAEIDTLEDLLMSGIPFGGYIPVRAFCANASNPVIKGLYDNWVGTPDIDGSFERVVKKRNFAVTLDRKALEYLIKERYHDNSGNPLLHITKEYIISFPSIMILPLGSPILPPYNRIIRQLGEGGLIDKWDKNITSSFTTKDQGQDPVVITNKHLTGAYAVLLFGLVPSVLVFMLEYFWNRIHISRSFPPGDRL